MSVAGVLHPSETQNQPERMVLQPHCSAFDVRGARVITLPQKCHTLTLDCLGMCCV